MKRLLPLLIFTWTTSFANAQDIIYARVIAVSGQVTINDLPLLAGQEVRDKDATIMIGSQSYVTLLSNEGNLKTYDTKGRIKMQYLTASMRPSKSRILGSNVGCGPLTLWRAYHQEASLVVGDSVLLKWKSDFKPPYNISINTMFADKLASFPTTYDSIFIPVDKYFKTENVLLISLESKNGQSDILLRLPNEKTRAKFDREIAALSGTEAERKALRIAILKSNGILLDHYYEATLLSALEIASLPSDLRTFIEITRALQFDDSVK